MGAETPGQNRRETYEEAMQREAMSHAEYQANPADFLQRAAAQVERMDESAVPQLIETLRRQGFRLESRVRDNVFESDSQSYKLTYTFKKNPERNGMPEMTVRMEVADNGYWLTIQAHGNNYDRTFYNNPISAERVDQRIRETEQMVQFDMRLSHETGFHFETYYGDRDIIYVRDGQGSIPGLEMTMEPMPYGQYFEDSPVEISINVPSGSDSEWARFPNPERYSFHATVTGPQIHTKILELLHRYVQERVL